MSYWLSIYLITATRQSLLVAWLKITIPYWKVSQFAKHKLEEVKEKSCIIH